MKEKALVLNLSRWEIDGNRGGKITWTTFDRVGSENRLGVEILTASCPFDALSSVSSVPCVAELDLTLTASNVNGRAVSKVSVLAVHQLDEKKIVSNCLSVSLNS